MLLISQSAGVLARDRIEATGPIHWFERLLTELGHELWIGDSARIRASEVRKQKTDERDARLILDLMLAKRFRSCACAPCWATSCTRWP
jgi:transposase